jgi:hypothetical protein
MKRIWGLCAAWLLAAVCLVGRPVAAQQPAGPAPGAEPQAGNAPSDAAKNKASEHFRRGVELFQEGAFRAALVEFERAYEVAPHYRLLYNIGQTRLQLQEYLGAIQAYEGYLVQGGADVPQARRDDVEGALEVMRERIGRFSISTSRDGADVFVDDAKVGVTPLTGTVSVNVGRHRIYAVAPDGSEASKVVDIAGGDLLEVQLELKAPEGKPAIAPVTLEPVDEPMSAKMRGAFISFGVGGAALVGAVVTGVMAKSSADDLDAELDKDLPSRKKVEDARDSADSMAITSDVLSGLAVAGVVVGVVLWLTDDGPAEETEQAKLEWGVGLGSAQLRGRF